MVILKACMWLMHSLDLTSIQKLVMPCSDRASKQQPSSHMLIKIADVFLEWGGSGGGGGGGGHVKVTVRGRVWEGCGS